MDDSSCSECKPSPEKCVGKECQQYATHILLENTLPDLSTLPICCKCYKNKKPTCGTIMMLMKGIESDLAKPSIQWGENTDLKFPISHDLVYHNLLKMRLLLEVLTVFTGKLNSEISSSVTDT